MFSFPGHEFALLYIKLRVNSLYATYIILRINNNSPHMMFESRDCETCLISMTATPYNNHHVSIVTNKCSNYSYTFFSTVFQSF